MNSEVAPFNNVKVRQAVNHAIDPDAINRVQGGVIRPAWTHRDRPKVSRAMTRTSEDLYPHDIAKAKALVKESGTKPARRSPSGPTRRTRPSRRWSTTPTC